MIPLILLILLTRALDKQAQIHDYRGSRQNCFMDPTKSFDHLDPKLKETYARVMGTDTSSSTNATPATATPSSSPDPALSATPISFDPTQPTGDQNQTFNPSATGPNPGTGPTVSNLPTDTSSMFSTPLSSSAEPVQDPNAPSTSSFFSNPSPATSDPTLQTDGNNVSVPLEASPSTPITPYTPEGINGAPQPLPSPASVSQQSEHQTSPLLKVLYIIGAVIFFAVYTIFWIKVFNLPFLF